MTDEAIIEMLLERSEESISEIDAKYGKRCRKIAMDILGNEHDAEECVNDAYFTVWNAIPPEVPTSFFGFLYKILRNISLKKYRANRAMKRNTYYSEALDELDSSTKKTLKIAIFATASLLLVAAVCILIRVLI